MSSALVSAILCLCLSLSLSPCLCLSLSLSISLSLSLSACLPLSLSIIIFLLLLLLLCVSVSRLLLMRTISLFFTACFCVAFILTSSHSLSPSFPSIGPRNVSSTEVHPCFKCTLPHPLHRQGERPQAVFREYSTVPLLSREAEKHSAHLTDSDF